MSTKIVAEFCFRNLPDSVLGYTSICVYGGIVLLLRVLTSFIITDIDFFGELYAPGMPPTDIS
jgi:hypothetical protein